MDTGSVGQRRVFADYGDLRAYSGSASVIEISSPGIEGSFVRDRNDVNTRDNGATIIVGNNGSRWKRQYKGAADARWFGARGNNVADDALALQACLDAGLDLFLKEGLTFYSSSPLRFSADSQRMSGGGTLRTNGEIAISAVSLRGVSVTGLKIVCANSASCVGILFSRVAKSTIAYCTISRHGDAGVKLVDGCSENQILSNTFYVAASNPKFGLPSASDINIWGVATRNVIRENKCLAKGGYGIQINSHYVDAKSQGNVVDGNLIDDYNSYGIMLYRNGPYVPGDKQGVLGTLVTGNVVRNISGARPADPGNPLVRSFGAGIYIQGAEETLVRNNRISDCNGATNSLLLAPGAIGVGSVGGIIIEGNIISDSAQTGIYINDSNSLGVKDAEIIVRRNVVSGCRSAAFKIVKRDHVKIVGNEVAHCDYGIVTSNSRSGSLSDHSYLDNAFSDIKVTAIDAVYLTGANISGNRITSCGAKGISTSFSENVAVGANDFLNCGRRNSDLAVPK